MDAPVIVKEVGYWISAAVAKKLYSAGVYAVEVAGADLCGNASDFLRKAMESKAECENFVETLSLELKTAMFCTGCKNIQTLKSAKMLYSS